MRRIQKAFQGSIVAIGFFFIIEMLCRMSWGAPPTLESLVRVAQCSLRSEGGRSWMECGHPEDRVELSTEKTKPRVVVLGGSSVRDPFKADPNDNFPEHLGRLMPRVEVVNLGKAGQSMAGVAWTASQLDSLKPDLVVIYEGHNDYAQTLFSGRISGTPLWTVPVLRILQNSWIFQKLTQETRGVVVGPKRPQPVQHDPSLPPPPALCQQLPPSARRGVVMVEDDIALRVRDEVRERFRADLTTAIRQSPAPVIVSTLLRNPEYPPGGVVGKDNSACGVALGCMGSEHVTDHAELATYAEKVCGENSISLWLRSRARAEAGDQPGAIAAWRRSMELDAVPLRAPYVADEVVREVAGKTGATLLDLEAALGPLPAASLFTDTLHPSTEGAEAIAQALLPVVQGKLGSE